MSEHDSADTSGCLPWLIGALVVLALLAWLAIITVD